MIYFIQAEKTGLIKIGYSNNPKERCFILKSSNADNLCILKIIEGNSRGESELHKKFRKFRHHNEWYYPNKEILNFIAETDSYLLGNNFENELEVDGERPIIYDIEQPIICQCCQIPMQLKSKDRYKDWYECPKCENIICVYNSFDDFVEH